jgi:hypothetical protein
MSDRPFVPLTFSDEAEHRRKLAEAIVTILNKLEELDNRLRAIGG